MKHLNLFAILFTLTMGLTACNDHNKDSGNDDDVATVDTLSPSKTALWVELESGDYDFALAKNYAIDYFDLIGHRVDLPSGLSAMIVTGEDQIIIEADDLVEIWTVTDVGQFEMFVRNVWYMPAGWQPNLFPQSEGEAADLEILLSAFICGQSLDPYSRGCQGSIPSSLFRKVENDIDYFELDILDRAAYVFVVRR